MPVDLADRLIAQITDAVKYESKLRLALNSLSGDGKTLTALVLAQRLCSKIGPEAKILLADSEHQSALKYADLIPFRHLSLPDHSLETYLAVFDAAERLPYPVVLVIDSGSHSWNGRGGALEEVDTYAETHRTQRGAKNTFNAWAPVRPKINRLIDRINDCACHLIVTFRLKKKNVQTVDANGKTVVEAVGLEVIAPDMMDYEFDVVGDLTRSKELVITKTRCPRLAGKIFRPLTHTDPLALDKEKDDTTVAVADILWDWLKGAPPKPAVSLPPVGPRLQSDPNAVYLALYREFQNTGQTAFFHDRLERHGLSGYFANLRMNDPAIADKARVLYKALKSQLELNLLERAEQEKQKPEPPPAPAESANPQPVTQSTGPQDDSPGTAAVPPQPQPEPESPVVPPVTAEPCAPAHGQVRKLEISDFSRKEMDELYSIFRHGKPRSYNRATLANEILSFEGTREDFLKTANQKYREQQQQQGGK